MLIEKGIANDGRNYELRQGLTGAGNATCCIFFDDGQEFRGSDLKPLSVAEARHYLKWCC